MLFSSACRFLICAGCVTSIYVTNALSPSSLGIRISTFLPYSNSSGTGCGQFVISGTDDGYFTTAYKPGSCTALPSTARVKYGSDSNYYFTGLRTFPASFSAYKKPAECSVACSIWASGVRLIYWTIDTNVKNTINGSTTTKTPSAPSGFVSNGFTFTSPSVYVAYTFLKAVASCNNLASNQRETLGQIYNTTIAYAPEALSTFHDWTPMLDGYSFTAITYTELQYSTLVTYQLETYVDKPVMFLSLPADLSLVDRAWKGCIPNEFGAGDPPRTLGSASALVSLGSLTHASLFATPGPTIPPAHAPATPTPEPKGPGFDAFQTAEPGLGPAESHLGSNSDQIPSSTDPDSPDPNVATPTLQAPDSRESAISSINLVVGSAAPTSSLPHDVSGEHEAQVGPSNPDATIRGSSGGEYPGDPSGNNPNAALGSGPESNTDLSSADPVQPLPSAGDLPSAGNLPSAADNQAQTDEAGSLLIGSNRGDNVAGLTISAGSKSTIAGYVISAFTSSGAVFGSIYGLPFSGGAGSQPSVPPDPLNHGDNLAGLTISAGSKSTIAGYVISAFTSSGAVFGSIYGLPFSGGAGLQPSILLSDPLNHGDTLAGLTIQAGSKSTIAGHMISAFTSSGAVYGSIYALPLSGGAGLQPSFSPSGPLLIAGQSVVRASGGGIIIGSSTIEPGSLITMSGHSVSAGQSAVNIDGSTYTLPSSVGAAIQQYSNLPAITFAGSGIISAGGAPITLSGNVYSILSGGSSNLVANGLAVTLSKTAQSVFQIDGQTYTAVPTGFAISGNTIAVGAPAVTIGGTVLLLGPSGLQVGSSTIPLNAVPTGFAISGNAIAVGAPAVTIGGTVLSLGPSGLQVGSSTIPLNAVPTGFAISGNAIAVGAPAVTIGGTVLSLGPSGLQVGSSTIPLNAVPTGFAISGQAIAVGAPAVTIDGIALSLGSSGLEIGSSTIPLNVEQTDQANSGDPIMSGFGSMPNATSGATNDSSVTHFTGGSPKSANKSLVDIRIAVLYLVGMAIGIAAYAL